MLFFDPERSEVTTNLPQITTLNEIIRESQFTDNFSKFFDRFLFIKEEEMDVETLVKLAQETNCSLKHLETKFTSEDQRKRNRLPADQ